MAPRTNANNGEPQMIKTTYQNEPTGSQVTGRRASHNEIAPIGKVWYQLSLYEISGDAW